MMLITELLQSAQFVVDADANKKAVVLDYTIWEELLTLLEDLIFFIVAQVRKETRWAVGRGLRTRDWYPYPVGSPALVQWR